MQNSTNDRFLELDGLRGVAIAIVVLSHLYGTGELPIARVFSHYVNGGIGVGVFFTLSGFLITRLLLKEEHSRGRISLYNFYIKRAFRILPAAFFYLLCLWVLGKISIIAITIKDLSVSAFFMRNFMMGADPAKGFSEATAHYWSLAVEEQFYFFWPIALLFTQGRSRLICAIFLLAIAPLAHAMEVIFHLLAGVKLEVFSRVVSYACFFPEIMIGCILSLLRNCEKCRVGRQFMPYFLSSSWCIGFTFILALLVDAAPVGTIIKPHLKGCCFAVIINAILTNRASLVSRIMRFPLLVWLGKISFSLYLWQQLFCWAFKGSEPAWFQRYPVSVLMSLAIACSSYFLIETTFFKLRERFMRVP